MNIDERSSNSNPDRRSSRASSPSPTTTNSPYIQNIELPFIPKSTRATSRRHWHVPERTVGTSHEATGSRRLISRPSTKRPNTVDSPKMKQTRIESLVLTPRTISPVVESRGNSNTSPEKQTTRKKGKLVSKSSSNDCIGKKRRQAQSPPFIEVQKYEKHEFVEVNDELERAMLADANVNNINEAAVIVHNVSPRNLAELEVSTLQLPPSRMSSMYNLDLDNDSRTDSFSNLSMIMREKTLSWKKTMERRTSLMKEHIMRPPSPDQISLVSTKEGDKPRRLSLTSFIGAVPSSMSFDTSAKGQDQQGHRETFMQRTRRVIVRAPCKWNLMPRSMDRQSKKYLVWLGIVAAFYLYNAFSPPLRTSFPYQTAQNWMVWMTFDLLADFVYVLDMCVMKPRLRFMQQGLTIKTPPEMRKHYLMGKQFKLDLLSILPTDVFYIFIGYRPIVRLNRVFKILNYWEFFQCVDSWVKNPTILRIGRILIYIIYMIHCNCCIFYSFSAWQGFDKARYFDAITETWLPNKWVYNNKGNAYLRCFYFTTKVATSIGNNPSPTNVLEFGYMLISWMIGVFVFALLLGQIRDIIATSQKNRDEFRKQMDAALQYCKALKVPQELQDRVREWFIHTWRTQKTLDENILIEKLPHKLQTDLAISVHYHTLSKVQLFQDCDKALLRDLVLKLKPVLYLPGDYICKKGEVGKEMYIVAKGVLEVVGGPEGTTVFATLNEGSSFGEISLLSLAGGNRRTANVISKGFSNLFVLSKDDLNETLRDYPEAQRIMRRKAEKVINKDNEPPKKQKDDLEKMSEVTTHINTPRLVSTIAQIINPTSDTGKQLNEVLDKDNRQNDHSDSDEEKIVFNGMNIKQLYGIVEARIRNKDPENMTRPEKDNNAKIKQHFLSLPIENLPSRPESASSFGKSLKTLPPSQSFLLESSSDSD